MMRRMRKFVFGLLICLAMLGIGELHAKPRGIAHRGLISASYPENTMPAFEAACKSNIWGIEYDVRQTSDKKIVICHDVSVESTSDGIGLVYDLKLEELKRLNFGVKKGMSDVRIPEFDEVFDLCLANGKMQVIEIKDGASIEDVKKYWIKKLGKKLGKRLGIKIKLPKTLLKKYGIRDRVPEGIEVCDVVAAKIRKAKAEKTTTIACFTIRILQYVQKNYPDIQTHLFIGDRNFDKYIDTAEDKVLVEKGLPDECLVSVKSVGVKADYLTAAIVRDFHARGLTVDAWNVNSKEVYERMIKIGVDSVTLDDEALLQ